MTIGLNFKKDNFINTVTSEKPEKHVFIYRRFESFIEILSEWDQYPATYLGFCATLGYKLSFLQSWREYLEQSK